MRELCATLAGPVAARCLGRNGTGHVLAVFSSVFYLRLNGSVFCVAARALEPGPLALVIDVDGASIWRRVGIRVGQKAIYYNGILCIAALRLDLSNLVLWTPPAPPHTSPQSLTQGLDRHRRATLQPPLTGQWDPATLRDAGTWIADQRAGALRDPVSWAQMLVGRGPGLTPSGDDFLGGMMIALHALNRPAAAQRLWGAIGDAAQTATHEIARAFLAAAAEGHGSAGLHRAMNALLAGGSGLEPALADIDRIGHSSGWDALAGITSVFSAFAEASGIQAA